MPTTTSTTPLLTRLLRLGARGAARNARASLERTRRQEERALAALEQREDRPRP